MRASHVIIRGHVFQYEEKAPFVPSGQSVLGALEYDETTDKVRCHECGTWIGGLGTHVKVHGISRKEYNRRHGMRTNAALSGLKTRQKHREAAIRNGNAERLQKSQRSCSRGKGSLPRSQESHNQNARCAAQLLFRVQNIAVRVGRTPTNSDMREAGIDHSTLVRRFGSLDAVMKILGLEVNRGAHPSPIPKGFRAVGCKEWEARMPWPEDYFSVNPLEQRRG